MTDCFIGLEALRTEHARQVAAFEDWAAVQDWYAFHVNHYDWWAYPVNRRSSYGERYKLTDDALDALRRDDAFLTRWRRGVALGCLAWGWELAQARYVETPEPGQAWAHWPVRLYKMAVSAMLLGQSDVLASLCALADDQMAKGEDFTYNGRDLRWVFLRLG